MPLRRPHPGKDITLVQLGDQGSRFAALAGGTVQATVISPPFDLTAKKLGYRILADMADLGLHYQHEAVATSERFLVERPETARKFLKAFIAGIHIWMTDETKTKEILVKRLRIKDKEVRTTYSPTKNSPRKTLPNSRAWSFRLPILAAKWQTEAPSSRPCQSRFIERDRQERFHRRLI
jgi:ABC-type nitrate/sulfonate/bicarbonate transport system substrate-binding protein